MKKPPNNLSILILAAALLSPAIAPAAEPSRFKATMDMFHNGKLVGETTFSFSTEGGQWIMRSNTTGTQGLAKVIGVQEHSSSRGDWSGDRPRPLSFERNVKAGKKLRWAAEFDWSRGEVRSTYPDGQSTLEIQPGVVDESTLGMVIRAGLEHGEDEWFLQVLDEDEIEQQHFRSRPAERIETVLGCVNAYAVEKIRRAGSTRYTRTYHASDHGFVPVLIEHGKTDGDHLESRLKSLEIDGVRIRPGPGCG